MNQLIFKYMCLSFLLASLVITAGCKNDALVYQVNDVVSDPGAYVGDLTLEGVVYTFAKDNPSIVGVMDKKELQCTTPNCKKTLMAVQVVESKLAVGDEVKVSGAIVKESWGYLLKAEQVKVMNNHKLGGA
jgi:hypothetical protein